MTTTQPDTEEILFDKKEHGAALGIERIVPAGDRVAMDKAYEEIKAWYHENRELLDIQPRGRYEGRHYPEMVQELIAPGKLKMTMWFYGKPMTYAAPEEQANA